MWTPDPPRHTLGQLHRQLLVVGLVWFTRSATALLDDLFSHYFDYEFSFIDLDLCAGFSVLNTHRHLHTIP